MAKPLRVALIGQKFMGRAHSNAWGQAGRFFNLPRPVQLSVVCGRDQEELAAFAERWGWARHHTRWEDLAQDPGVDLVDIGTPNHLHAPQALAMLAAGKHVACEKPLAGTLDDARAMRDAAAAAKRCKTFVWFNYRRCPAVALARELVAEGRLGDLHHLRATYLQSWGGPDTPRVWRFQKKFAGSGAHGDLNAHIVDMARFVTGEELTEVTGALARTFIKKRPDPKGSGLLRSDVDDAVLFIAALSGGGTASFEASRVAPGHHNRNTLELNGSQGSLRFDFEDMNVLWLHDGAGGARTGGWRRIMCTSGAGGHPWVDAWWPDAHVLGYEHGFVNMAADIVAALAGKRPRMPLPNFEDAWQTQRVLQAALVSAAERRAVRLTEIR